MKNLSILCINMLLSMYIFAQNGIFIYPVNYEDSKDILIKVPHAPDDLLISIEGEPGMLELVDDYVKIKNRELSEKIELRFSSSLHDSVQNTILIENKFDNNVSLDLPLYQALTQWAIDPEQDQKLSDYLLKSNNKKNIQAEEILFFLQHYFDNGVRFNRNASLESNVLQAFKTFKDSNEKASGCQCIQLNHEAEIAPLKPGAGQYGNGYNYLDNNGQFSQGINKLTYFSSSSPKWHRWYTNEKGPAHEMFLRQYDQGGSFNFEWSSLASNGGNTISPNNASLLFNFFCSEIGQELPDECDCTKKLTVFYRYDANFKVIASKLKPLSKVHSVAQEISTLTYSNTSGDVTLVDAGMAKYETKCNGDFNFEFIKNWFELGEAVLGLVIDVQDTVNGTIPQDILTNLGDIANALEQIATTSPIEVSGDCTPKNGRENLMAGNKTLYLKANDPVVVNLSSFTFLGTYGKRKWDNYAKIGSNFWLQGFVNPGSLEGHDHCCSDKVTRFVQASVKGPKSESDLVNWIESWVKLFAPWENFTQIGDIPVISRKANRGYFIYDDPERDCFPASPKKSNDELDKSISKTKRSVITEQPLEDNVPNIAENSLVELGIKLYPNPTNDFINIEVSNCKDSHLSISLYNTLGQEIALILNQTMQLDRIKVQWLDNEHKLNTGTYFVVVKQNNEIAKTQAISIVK